MNNTQTNEELLKRKALDITFLDFDDIKNHLLSGGQARATLEVAKRLVGMGHRVTIICSRFPGSRDQFHEGIWYKHIGLGSKNIKLNNLVWFAALPFAVRGHKTDVYIEAFTAPISTCFSPLFTSIPVIGMPTMFEADQFAKKYHLPFHWIEALGAKVYRYFLAYSPLNKIKMEKLNPRIHTRIIPNGVSEEFFTIPTTEKPYAAFIGRIDIVQKGLDLLIEAIAKVKDALPYKIVLAGNGPATDEQKLRDLIANNGLKDVVSFIGRVDGDEKIAFLSGCSFGVYPSRFEDFPLVPLEFAALGKPVVCFDVPGLAWVEPQMSLKAPAFDVSRLAETLVEIGKPEVRARLAEGARPFAQKYGWDNISRQYADYCYEVIELDKSRKTKKK